MQCHCHSIKFLSLWNLTELAGILFVSSPCSELFPSYGQIISNSEEEDKQSALYWDPTKWRLEIGIRTYKVFEELITKKRKDVKSCCEPGYDVEKDNIHILELLEDNCIED
jgi:hypothetical protein